MVTVNYKLTEMEKPHYRTIKPVIKLAMFFVDVKLVPRTAAPAGDYEYFTPLLKSLIRMAMP